MSKRNMAVVSEQRYTFNSSTYTWYTQREADEPSRTFTNDTEWSLTQGKFKNIIKNFPNLTVDLFASRFNHTLQKYVTIQNLMPKH
jgi:hypothetical protein